MCKTHEGHEVTFETRQKIKNKQKGRKNPWTIEYNKNRIPPSGWHHTEESKQKIREKVSGKNNGQFGKPPAPVKPFIFIDKRNRKIILRSSWELRLAEYFDKNDIYWEYEKITYNLSNGSTYTPDFFTSNIIYEVKGWFHGKNKEKYELFCKEYPHIKIILADRNFLEETLNIKL